MADEKETCSVGACHCNRMFAEYIVGPMRNGEYCFASKTCAEMHVMAGFQSRSLNSENLEKYSKYINITLKKS